MAPDEEHRRRGNDPMLQSVLDSLKVLSDTVHQGFRDAHSRIDDIYKQVGKIEGLDSKVNSFIALMEKMNDHAAGDIAELKEKVSKNSERIAKLEGKEIASEARSGVAYKAFDIFARSWLGPILAAVGISYFVTKAERPLSTTVSIQPPVAIAPVEPLKEIVK